MITEKTYKALFIVRRYESGITARQFAEKMWPDSDRWNRILAGHKGAGMYLCAGSYLHKLLYKKYVGKDTTEDTTIWQITSEGKNAMAEYDLHYAEYEPIHRGKKTAY